jgi:DNA-binding transcriptional MocR family regulator
MARLSDILPPGSFVRRPTGGCLLWIAFPPDIDGTKVFEHSAGKGLIAAPGDLFSASCFFNHCIRLNAGRKLTKARSDALLIIGELAHDSINGQKKENLGLARAPL